MRAALLQLNGSDDPSENLATVLEMADRAVGQGAGFLLTPEVTNCVSMDRAHQTSVLRTEEEDPVLLGLKRFAAERGVWVLLGSAAMQTDDPEGRFANRSVLIGPDGETVARYDKIHMFDVDVSETESYRESAGFRPGGRAICADTDFGRVGLTVCYDLRFPGLFRQLAQAGAEVITVPSAFSPVTGAAHWHALLRARAIETGCFILAPAQTGKHRARQGRARSTYGHSLAVSPWGEVICDAGTETGIVYANIDLAEVSAARKKIPSVRQEAHYSLPQ